MTISALQRTDFEPIGANEAAKRFARKVPVPSDVFDELSATHKAKAFRIAGVHKARLIQRTRTIVARAIQDGESVRDVQLKLLKIFDAEKTEAPPISRLRLVFQQNAMEAYNDARRDVLDDDRVTPAFPFRQYLTVGNGTAGVRGVRPEHAALHGLVFRWDDPFWDAHTPPWDFGCRCTIAALTRGQVKRMGVKVRGIGFVRNRIKVEGTRRRGIAASTFSRDGGKLKGFDKTILDVLRELLG